MAGEDRGTGLTMAMVKAIPDIDNGEPIFVVVPNLGLQDYVGDMIKDLRGPSLFNRCKIVVVREEFDMRYFAGRGIKPRQVHFDHTVDPGLALEITSRLRP